MRNPEVAGTRAWRFAPPLWAWLAAATAMAAFCALGVWQLHRGDQKRALQAQVLDAAQRAPVALTRTAAAPPAPAVQRAVAAGVYLAHRQLLEDGQSHDGQPGFDVWTPLRLADGGLLLVDRGWVPQPVESLDLSPPAGPQAVSGQWRALPQPGLQLERSAACERAERFPLSVLYPDARQLSCLLGETVLDGVLLLDPEAPGGYVRTWHQQGFPPERHYAYAAQWFAFAALVFFLFIRLNLKRL